MCINVYNLQSAVTQSTTCRKVYIISRERKKKQQLDDDNAIHSPATGRPWTMCHNNKIKTIWCLLAFLRIFFAAAFKHYKLRKLYGA